MKLNKLFTPFLDDLYRSGRKPSTLLNHRVQLEKVINPTIGNMQLNKMLLIDANKVIEYGRENGGTSIANHATITLRRLLKFAVASGYKLNFDWRDIEVPKYKVKSDVQVLTLKEIDLIRKYLREDNFEFSKHYRKKNHEKHEHMMKRTLCLIEVLLHTGLRISEALAINIEDINFETKELRVENVKTGTWDSVYLHGCTEAISDYISYRTDEHPALFVSGSGERLSLDTAKSTLARLKKRVRLKKCLTHKLFRSTFVTILLQAKRDPKEVQLLARHQSLQTTLDYYYKVQKEKLKPVHKLIMEHL